MRDIKYTSKELALKLGYYKNLSEKSRRHFLAIEYTSLGIGSQRYLAEVFGCCRKTIIKGGKELEAAGVKDIDYSRQRKAGGGAKKKEVVEPDIPARIEKIISLNQAGSPTDPTVKWTHFDNSIYIGPSNPVRGKKGDDYRREPQDLMDAAAMRHDKDYGRVEASGPKGAILDKNTIPADIALVQRANQVIRLHGERAIDPYTGEPVSDLTLKRAKIVKAGFTELIKRKVVGTTEYIFGRSDEALDGILKKERAVDNTESKPENY